MYRLIRQSKTVYFVAALITIAVSIWVCFNSVINPDGVCYLQSAKTTEEGINSAMRVCEQAKWPFYAVLIATFVKISSFSYLNAAHILDTFFAVLSVIAFISIVSFLAKQQAKVTSNNILWLAALVILLANEFNAIKNSIVRDHGFWAFYLFSILFLLLYCQNRSWKYAVSWSLSLIIATLFRIEGAIFLLCMPLLVWFSRDDYTSRLKSFLKLNTITFIVGLLLGIWLLFHPGQSVGRLHELQFQLIHGFDTVVENFKISSSNLANHVLSVHAGKDASHIFFIMIIFWYLFSVISNLSFIYAFLVIYAWMKKLLDIEKSFLRVLWGYVFINVLVTLAFLFQHLFLSERYLIASSLTFMLWTPFALQALLLQWPRATRKWPYLLLVFFLICSSLSGIFEFGHSKRYLRDAGTWLAENTSANVKLYSNDPHVLYYSSHFGNNIFDTQKRFRNLNVIAHGGWQQYDYLAIRIKRKTKKNELNVLNELKRAPTIIFDNHQGEQVQIYKL